MNHKHRKNLIIALGLLMSAIIVALQAQSTVHAVPNQGAFVNPIYNAKPGSESSQLALASQPETAVLYPDTLDPPASCGVPLHAPFGQDVEILMSEGPDDPMYQLSLNPGWHDQQWLPKDNSTPIEDIVAVAQGTEKIVAAWVEPGEGLRFETWDSSNGWSGVSNLEQYPDSGPALLSRNAYNWVIFTRVGYSIYFREWNNGVLGEWEALPGITGDAAAVSEPVVISKDPNHMAVFYRDASGAVWFTEGVLGGEETADLSNRATQVANTLWRKKPVSLSGIEEDFDIYLPLVMYNAPASSFVRRDILSPITGTPDMAAEDIFTLASELSVVSRNENHLAVFGVDADNQLWVNEWTNRNASDWHDTEWVKLMEDVAIERPSVTSRHSNHLGLAVRDTSGEPWYLEWTYAGGWKPPVSLGGTRNNPLTIAAPRLDSLSVFTVEAGEIWHKEWTEEQSWGHWLPFTDTTAQDGQILVAAARQMDDLMLLGRRNGGDGFYKHFTSLDQALQEGLVAPGSPGWSPKTLAWVDSTTLMAATGGTEPGIWEIVAMSLTNGITETLPLPEHPLWSESSSGAMAAGDLDLDGSDEVVIATTTMITQDISISVIDFAVSPTLTVTLASTIIQSVPEGGNSYVDDVAIGDLDGDGRQDEVALTYRTVFWDNVDDWHVVVFEYDPTTSELEYRGQKQFTAPRSGFEAGQISTAIGKVFDRHPLYGKLSSAQLIVAATNDEPSSPTERKYVHTEVYSMTLTSSDWAFIDLDAFDGPDFEVSYLNAIDLSTGDLNADGLEEIVYSRAGAINVIGYDRDGNRDVASHPSFGGTFFVKVRHAVGDVDQDGKAEIVYWATANQVAFLDLVDDHTLHQSSSIMPTLSYGELLIGDLDGDSFNADLAGCSDFSEISVIAVLNGAPRLYAGGLPAQDTDVRYAKTASGGSSSAWGTSTNLGCFFSVGFEVELNVPLIGTKLGEVRGSVTQDFMASQGQTQTVEESVTLSSGYNNASGQTLGIVVYNGTDYRCYYYDVYAPATPTQTSRAMICQPLGNTYEHFRSLEQWHSASFKQQAGASWVDVGHRTVGGVRTNEVNTYPSGLPVDPYLLKHTWDPTQPFRVDYDVSGGYTDWSITQMGGGARETSQSFETNTTTSVGATVGNVTVDAGFTFGFGWDRSRAVSWSNELEIGGSVYLNSDPAFANCVYTVVPYIYHAKATSQAGATYPYLEMDYYVPSLTGNCSPLSNAQAMESLFMDKPEPE